jgi:hypothetical protein
MFHDTSMGRWQKSGYKVFTPYLEPQLKRQKFAPRWRPETKNGGDLEELNNFRCQTIVNWTLFSMMPALMA